MFFRIRTGVPTYVELLKYAQEKQRTHNNVQNHTNEISKEDESIQERNTNEDTYGLDMTTEIEANTRYSIIYTHSLDFIIYYVYSNIIVIKHTTLFCRNEIDVNERNTSLEIVMNLLEKEKREKESLMKERNKLLEEKQTLVGKNEELNQQVEKLQKDRCNKNQK